MTVDPTLGISIAWVSAISFCQAQTDDTFRYIFLNVRSFVSLCLDTTSPLSVGIAEEPVDSVEEPHVSSTASGVYIIFNFTSETSYSLKYYLKVILQCSRRDITRGSRVTGIRQPADLMNVSSA